MSKNLVKPRQRQAVANFTILDPLHSLSAPLLGNVNGIYPRLDALFGRQLQQGIHLAVVTEATPRQLWRVESESLGPQLGQRLVRQTDHVELAADLEGGKVGRDVEFVKHVGAVEDKVKGQGPVVLPVLLARDDGLEGAQLQTVVDLGSGVREGVRLGSEGDGPLDAEVAEPADAAHGHLLPGADVGPHERRVRGDAGAEQRGRILRLELLRDAEGVVLVRADVRREAAVRRVSVRVPAVVRVHLGGAVVFVFALAQIALHAAVHLRAYAHAVALLDVLDVRPDFDGAPDDLVPDAQRAGVFAPAARDGVHVGAAYTARIDGNVNVVRAKWLDLQLGFVELVPCLGAVDAEAFKRFRVAHFDVDVCVYLEKLPNWC